MEDWVVNQMPVACAGANGTHGGTHPLATSLAEANAQSSLRGVPQPGPLHDLATILQAAGQSTKQMKKTPSGRFTKRYSLDLSLVARLFTAS